MDIECCEEWVTRREGDEGRQTEQGTCNALELCGEGEVQQCVFWCNAEGMK